jgi:hypothetical protein
MGLSLAVTHSLTSCLWSRLELEGVQSGVHVIKLFSFITDDEAQKARGRGLGNPFQLGVEFEGKAKANPIGGPFRCFLLG